MPDYTDTIGMRISLLRVFLLIAAVAAASAQSPVEPRESAEKYRAHASIGPHTVAADFHGRTVTAPQSSFVLKDYVVVEVALFPGRKEDLTVNAGRFSLRVNGAKIPLLAQVPGMVGASLRYANYGGGPQMTAAGGIGNAGVVLGGDPTARFPGDPRARRAPLPVPSPAPGQTPEAPPETPAWDFVTQLALEERTVSSPAAGLLYFPYKGKLEKLRKLELLYTGPEGDAVLLLRELR